MFPSFPQAHEAAVDDVSAWVPASHDELPATGRRLQLDVDLPVGLDDRGPLRQVAVLQRQRQAAATDQEFCGQQDQGRRLVRLKLWCKEQPAQIRQRAWQTHSGKQMTILNRDLRQLFKIYLQYKFHCS